MRASRQILIWEALRVWPSLLLYSLLIGLTALIPVAVTVFDAFWPASGTPAAALATG